MWIKRVVLKNFQKHEKLEVNFSKNLNFIVGVTDAGKTAIVRGLRWVFYNRKPRNFRRYGSDKTSVLIELDDGTEIIREKSDEVNRYVICKGGRKQIFDSFGTEVPLEIRNVLGISEANIDEKVAIELNIAKQLDSVFLLDQPNSFKAKVISNLSGTNRINDLIQEFNKDIRKLNLEKKTLENNIISLNEEIKKFAFLKEHKEELDDILKQINKLEEANEKLELLNEIKEEILDCKSRKKIVDEKIQKIEEILSKLPNIDQLKAKAERLEKLLELFSEISNWETEKISIENSLSKISVEIEDYKRKYGDILLKNNICPICYSKLTLDKVKDILRKI